MERAARDRRSLDILLVKKEAKLSASEVNDVEVGKVDVMQIYDKVTYLQFARDDGVVRNREDKIGVVLLFRRETKVVVAVAKRLKG